MGLVFNGELFSVHEFNLRIVSEWILKAMFANALDALKRIKPASGVFILLLVLGFTFYAFNPETGIIIDEDHYPFVENYAKFTIELNCTLPTMPDTMEILHVEGSSINEKEIQEIAMNVFNFENYSIQHKNNRVVLRSGNRTLSYYVTDYLAFRDSSYEDKMIEVNKTRLRNQADNILQLLDAYWDERTDTELVLERIELHDLSRITQSGELRSRQPQYMVYYHHLDDVPVLALNAEYSLGFADDQIVYAQISNINVSNTTEVEITKMPARAILETFPNAIMEGSVGVASSALVPVRGKIVIQNVRIFYYNWNDPLGQSYDLVPHYKITALLVGPDINGKIKSVLLSRWIRAVD